jgi:phage-related protein
MVSFMIHSLISDSLKRLPARFYRSSTGKEPVRDWLLELSQEDRKTIGTDVKDVEFSWPIGMPLCRPLTGQKGLWEVRSSLKGGRIARLLFYVCNGEMILLHGFLKTTQKTPQQDIDLAVKRKKDHEHHA